MRQTSIAVTFSFIRLEFSYLKLLILLPSTARGGNEEFALTIATAAAQRGWAVHAALPGTTGTESLFRDFRSISVTCHKADLSECGEKGFRQIAGHVFRCLRVLSLIARLRPDAILLSLPWASLGLGAMLACALRRQLAVVVFQLVGEGIHFTPRRVALSNWCRHRQTWVAVSENNRRLLAAYFDTKPDRIALVRNGVSLPENGGEDVAQTHARSEIVQACGWNDSCKILLTVASLVEQKGHRHLIPVMPHIISEFPDARWLWVGEGVLRDELQQCVGDYGLQDHVAIVGYRDDVDAVMCAADLFVFPTLGEGQPFSLLEAISWKLPVISTSASGISEIVTHGEHGLLCRPGDSCELLEAIRYALRHPREMRHLAANAYNRAATFSEQQMIEETLSLVDKSNR